MTALSLNFYAPENGNAARRLAPVATAHGFEYWRCPDCRYCLALNLEAASNRCAHPNTTPAGAVIDRVEWESCAPTSWGLRLWNGRGEQMITVLFPNPYYDENFQRLKEPRWEKTALWEDFRRDIQDGFG